MKFVQSNDTRNPADDCRIALEAIEWLVRLLDTEFDPEEPYPDPLQRQAAFIQWLTLDAAHVRGFLEILEVERRAAHPDPQRLINIQELLATCPPVVVPIAEHRPGSRPAATPPASRQTNPRDQGAAPSKPRRWSLTLIAMAAGLPAVVVGLVLVPRPITGTSVYYSTALGERQTVLLADGSIVVLGAATRVAVTYDRQTREVRLIAGEAFFDVRHDTARPFRVIADDVFLEDLGAQFDVDRRSAVTRVTVAKGSIQLACGCVTRGSPSSTQKVSEPALSLPAHPSATVILAAGEGSRLGRSSKPLAEVASWIDEFAAFFGQRLDALGEYLDHKHGKRR